MHLPLVYKIAEKDEIIAQKDEIIAEKDEIIERLQRAQIAETQIADEDETDDDLNNGFNEMDSDPKLKWNDKERYYFALNKPIK